MERVQVDGVGIEYRRIAPTRSGLPTLVFLHEGLGCAATWRDYPDQLAAATGCGAVVYSRAGYGGSDPVDLPRPLSYMHDEGREVLPRLLEALDISDAVLVGHSDGASIAIVYAGATSGARLHALVLEAAHVFLEQHGLATIVAAVSRYEAGDLREKLARYHGANVDVAFWGWHDAWTDPGFETWNLEEFLPAIAVPTLVIQCRDDPYGTMAQVDAIERGAGGPVERLELDGCGHFPHLRQRAAVLEAVAEFVARTYDPEAPYTQRR